MSNFLAVATVTATLRRLLMGAALADVAGVDVTTVRPGEGSSAGVPANAGINIYLYQVTQNPHWRNADLPTRRGDGSVAERPRAAVDLHYLISFYGNENTLEPQRLLGSAVTFLHNRPTITRDDIRATVTSPSLPFLSSSDLADEIELVRMSPLGLTLEDTSRIWSVLLQTRYVLSVAYMASVVLLEADIQARPMLPAREVNLTAFPLRRPIIQRVMSDTGEASPILDGTTIRIEGLELDAETVLVAIDGTNVPLTSVTPNRIVLTLPSGLRAGPHAVQVRHGVRIGAPNVEHPVVSSNLGTFVIRPQVTVTAGTPDVVVMPPAGTTPARVLISLLPSFLPGQTVTLELLDSNDLVHTFAAEDHPTETTQAAFRVENLPAGTYNGRVRIDGAESPFTLDGLGQPTGPQVTLP